MTGYGEADQALLTDVYELTMAQAYFHEGMDEPATFSLFARKLPANRAYLVCAGLEDVLHHLEELSFSAQAIDYLHDTGIFSWAYLHELGERREEIWRDYLEALEKEGLSRDP